MNTANQETSRDEVIVARQAIYNAQLETIGYELLFRNSDNNSAQFDDSLTATQTLINTSFLELGIEQIVGSALAFINLPSNFVALLPHLPNSLEQSVLEIPITEAPTSATIALLRQLVENGQTIAIDHFCGQPASLPLLKHADYIKVDIQVIEKEKLPSIITMAHDNDCKAIALKVESHQEFEACKELGFDAFQGYFFNHPNLVKKEVKRSNAAVLLKLIERINDPKSTMKDIEQLIAQDVSLSYKLLRYINCATFALRREITSIRDAIIYIGLLQIRQWSTLLVISNAAKGKPKELLVIAMVRAHMCQQLASQTSNINPDEAFTVGLFSVLDAVMDISMEDLLDQLSFTASIKLALIEQSGDLGRLLKEVIHYEKGEWLELGDLQFPIEDYAKRFLEAIFFSEQQLASLEI
ncbi:MAG TPA: HDOD domain-containing protein [Ectothiorhodospiraceae bacterium]|nr:HDOD domain-containing protein [Ectothiorhodospiraceae bacterium]